MREEVRGDSSDGAAGRFGTALLWGKPDRVALLNDLWGGDLICISLADGNQEGLDYRVAARKRGIISTRWSVQAVRVWATSSNPRSAIACSRMRNFWTLPLAVMGYAVTNWT
jgi:hypothetical protein